MKVLFAVSNEEISEKIVKKYQQEYKEIISYKNVYYFNAILKEIQKDKSYDRIVISEELETFSHTQYDQIDKFIFDRLDSISDEASNIKGNDIPIILICSDRRAKGEQMLVKLFGIGIYNAVIGNDRGIEEVCELIYRPRLKKEAKNYYKIDVEEVNYQSENENDVSEMEIQNILAHYKSLGKNENRYIDSFNNIAAQYNDTQLRIISKFLPLNVRAVLEEKSTKYQQIMSFNNSVANSLRYDKEKQEKTGPSETLLKPKTKNLQQLSKPVVIPAAMNTGEAKKLLKVRNQMEEEYLQQEVEYVHKRKEPVRFTQHKQEKMPETQQTTATQIENVKNSITDIPQVAQQNINQLQQATQPVKRGRGRPRKTAIPEQVTQKEEPKRRRGRPKKITEQEEKNQVLPGFNNESINNESSILPGFDNENVNSESSVLPGFDNENVNSESSVLPGFDNEKVNNESFVLPGFNNEENNSDSSILPGFDEAKNDEIITNVSNNQNANIEESIDKVMPGVENNINVVMPDIDNMTIVGGRDTSDRGSRIEEQSVRSDYELPRRKIPNNNLYVNDNQIVKKDNNYVPTKDLTSLITPDKKIVTFVGTSKNGTSFIVNHVAQLLSEMGINTAILDATMNRNSYYIYTKNEEELRNIATYSLENLAQGNDRGIKINKNLTVYTSLADEKNLINRVDDILETLLINHSLILIDCDFDSPLGYFKNSNETYLVQSLDVLTIQPLTAFLRELKGKNILDEKKLKIILNKAVRLKGVTDKTIIGGMAFYNDPSMSFMTELFDRNLIKYISIPFEEEIYIRYLESIVNCEISLKGYTKTFMQILKELGNMVYPLIPSNQGAYKPPSIENSNTKFSPNMNNTLNEMKRRY